MKKDNLCDKKTALITGATSGIGAEFAKQLSAMGFSLILTGRNREKLQRLSEKYPSSVTVEADLRKKEDCFRLIEEGKRLSADVLINCAGMGVFGKFSETDIKKETDMIDLNVRACHILFKGFLELFESRGKGYILNVGSVAGFLPGPLMSGYYASKSYVLRQTEAVYLELLYNKSPVKVSVLCPGPVQTDFNRNAGITGSFKGITAEECVRHTIEGMKKGRLLIIPALYTKAVALGSKLLPAAVSGSVCYIAQKGKKRITDI